MKKLSKNSNEKHKLLLPKNNRHIGSSEYIAKKMLEYTIFGKLFVDNSKRGKTKSTPRFRKNGFQQLRNLIDSSEGPFKFLINHISKNNPLYNELKTNFKDKEFNQVLSKVFFVGVSPTITDPMIDYVQGVVESFSE
mgnify:CR=1 FL=1